jgi:hypothetical protein
LNSDHCTISQRDTILSRRHTFTRLEILCKEK